MPFLDRRDAGRRLAAALDHLRPLEPVVIGLPRGGVVVADEVAKALGAPLDVIVVRKLGAPGRPELGIGAIGEDGVVVLNDELISMLGVTPAQLQRIADAEAAELARRMRVYRGGRPPVDLRGRTVIIVDDGLATGYTAKAAIEVARRRGADRVILAVPVASPSSVADLRRYADEVVALETPANFMAVGQFYQVFDQTSDDEVIAILEAARRRTAGATAPPTDAPRSADAPIPVGAFEVEIPAGQVVLPGTLTVPPDPRGIVIFAHGSGSSRHSPRNRAVAQYLNQHGFATLLFDLLTPAEAADRRNVFDIELLARRLEAATRWVLQQPGLAELPIGYFGASTGAAAALWAAADLDGAISAVVSRGGRPDLAAPRLPEVTAPTLLIVGELDVPVIEMNRQAQALLAAPSELVIVPRAGHLFEEPGALEEVARLAAAWFTRHLG